VSFQQAIEFVKFHEGGDADRPADRGGHTAFGISSRSFPKHRFPDFWREPTWAKAEALYREYFWEAYQLSLLPGHYGVIAFDLVVQHPPRDAQAIFQRGLNWCGARLTVDGVIGPRTRDAASRHQGAGPRLLAERISYYGKIVTTDSSQKAFWPGWMWRTQCLQLYAFGVQHDIPVGPDGRIREG